MNRSVRAQLPQDRLLLGLRPAGALSGQGSEK
jgi:hypothetical protein